ncbi:hypothetical protein DMC30DRAFT_399441 [Rhodotorula diobovata]|uniref:Uncharacterized protein n=1 Tax=Rhodotorula diobovata TaxID=5288 RepID=A0A5C5FSG2_9BASI|nr:hypothetical protein DMC30DRAFT_399441 [Rhodotorula diobovata]
MVDAQEPHPFGLLHPPPPLLGLAPPPAPAGDADVSAHRVEPRRDRSEWGDPPLAPRRLALVAAHAEPVDLLRPHRRHPRARVRLPRSDPREPVPCARPRRPRPGIGVGTARQRYPRATRGAHLFHAQQRHPLPRDAPPATRRSPFAAACSHVLPVLFARHRQARRRSAPGPWRRRRRGASVGAAQGVRAAHARRVGAA